MIALIVVRIIQNKVVEYNDETSDKNWEIGLTSERIQKALNAWSVDTLFGKILSLHNLDDLDLKLILNSFKIDIPVKLSRKSELRIIKKSIKIKM